MTNECIFWKDEDSLDPHRRPRLNDLLPSHRSSPYSGDSVVGRLRPGVSSHVALSATIFNLWNPRKTYEIRGLYLEAKNKLISFNNLSIRIFQVGDYQKIKCSHDPWLISTKKDTAIVLLFRISKSKRSSKQQKNSQILCIINCTKWVVCKMNSSIDPTIGEQIHIR